MKKKLLAVALAGAMVTPLVVQAETTIFGRIHMSVDHLDNDVESALNVLSNSSFLGFRGREDLGNGLAAHWQIDSTIGFDTGTGSLANRNTFVGLSGAFGDVRVGRHDTPLKTISRRTDLFGDQVGDSRNLLASNAASGFVGGWDRRFNNSVLYLSPSVGGVQGAVHYSTNQTNPGEATFGETAIAATVNDDRDAWSANLTFSQGPIWVGGAFEQLNTDVAGDSNPRAWRLGARIGWEALTFTALWQNDRNQASQKRDAWGVGAAYTMGNNTFKAQYYKADSRDDLPDTGANQWSIGADHRLSKRTTVYAAYARTDNDASVNFTAFGAGHGGGAVAIGNGAKPKAFSVGLLHSF